MVLSIKDLTSDPWEKVALNYKLGDILEVEVKGEAKNKGYFVKIEEGVIGFLPFKELSDIEKRAEESSKRVTDSRLR